MDTRIREPAHGGRAGLGEVGLRPVVADALGHLMVGQAPDHEGPDQKRDRERREHPEEVRNVRYLKTRKPLS